MKFVYKSMVYLMVAVFAMPIFALNMCFNGSVALAQENSQAVAGYYSKVPQNATEFNYEGNFYYYTPQKSGITKVQASLVDLDNAHKAEIVYKIINMGFTLPQAINYVFPGFESFYNNLCKKVNIAPVDAMPYAQPNNCKISFKNKQNGLIIDKLAFYNAFFDSLLNFNNNSIKINTTTVFAQKDISDIKADYKLASSFSTNFSSSGQARRHNIATATNSINNTIIKAGQTVSFNDLTGERNEQNGYRQAKIILGGVYTDGFGGGVCQVSTTFYNACLLAGLDIPEVHNHSLPSSYISPCFDAMVNSGTSDLKVTNNTGHDVIVAAACIGDNCKVCIYGRKPQYTIVRRWEKYQTLPADGDVIVTDCSKFPNITPQLGETRISYSSDGFRAKGYLDYYDGDTLIKTIKIRDNTYNPKKGVILKLDTLP